MLIAHFTAALITGIFYLKVLTNKINPLVPTKKKRTKFLCFT
jgi:hypothetical protein